MKALLLSALVVIFGVSSAKNLPVAVFHGLGDTCDGMSIIWTLGYHLGTYVKCIETGAGSTSIMKSFKKQAQQACDEINKDDNFSGDFSVVGISQGALLARSVIEQCQMKGTVKRYISVGGPEMGTSGVPNCAGNGFLCSILDKMVSSAVFFGLAQNMVGPAGYFKNPKNYNEYLEKSTFLADLNNEKPQKHSSYVERIKKLEKVLLIKFEQDTMIRPAATSHFEFYNSNDQIVPLEQSDFYKQDYLGIRWLNEQGRLNRVTVAGDHLDYGGWDMEGLWFPILRD